MHLSLAMSAVKTHKYQFNYNIHRMMVFKVFSIRASSRLAVYQIIMNWILSHSCFFLGVDFCLFTWRLHKYHPEQIWQSAYAFSFQLMPFSVDAQDYDGKSDYFDGNDDMYDFLLRFLRHSKRYTVLIFGARFKCSRFDSCSVKKAGRIQRCTPLRRWQICESGNRSHMLDTTGYRWSWWYYL